MKNIQDYLHLYLGSECERPDGKRFKLTTLTIELAYIDKWKPILRPLSDMSEEEAFALEWYMWEGFPDVCFGDREEILRMFINSTDKYRPGFEPMVLAINWLRKNSFDIDGLIEAGLATDKTKI